MENSVTPAHHNDHVVQFYEDNSFVCDAVAQFLREGMDSGEAALVVAGEKNRRGIAAALLASGCDPELARSRGLLTELDAEEALAEFMQGDLRRGMPEEGAFFRSMGRAVDRTRNDRGGLRVFGEMVDVLIERGNEAGTARLEELWNQLVATRRFKLFCGYSLANFRRSEDSDTFRRICSLHTHVVPSESYEQSWDENQRRCAIAGLQQRSRALEAEVHERKSLERALRLEQDRLLEANRRKDEFIALLSHELRNPLAPILTSLDVMDVRGDTTSRREREIIRRQARHLAALVEDLLDVSRVASGKISLQKQPMEFAAVASAALEMANPLIQERQHTLEVNIPRLGLLLEADPVRLPQVISNLLANAAKYTPVGGRITFSAERNGHEIVVTVEDNGVGITHEALGNIFAPFIQGRRSLDRSEGGLGLGLTLVRSLTQLHGGSVSAESEGPGKGSCFTVRLPAASPARSRDSLPAEYKNGADPNGHAPAPAPVVGVRVLVVDDNRDGAIALARLLGQLGYDVRTAHDGHEALELAQDYHPTVAFVDIGLPEMDGYVLATRLRQMQNGTPLHLVAVTGYGQATDRAKGVLAGFDEHVVKPLELGALRPLLARSTEVRA